MRSSRSGPVISGLMAALATGPTRLMRAWERLDMAADWQLPDARSGRLYSLAARRRQGRRGIDGSMWRRVLA